MERNRKRIASHSGVVTGVEKGRVAVQIKSVSACASCEAHKNCGFADSKDKTVDVNTQAWANYHPGDTVKVNIDEGRGMLAVWIAYVLPAILLLTTIIGLSIAKLPEWAVVLAAFAVLGLYIVALYLRRKRIEGRFTLTIEQC